MGDDPVMSELDEMTWWMFDTTCIGMGAERQFDYTMDGTLGRDLSPRLGNCYELAMRAFTGWEKFGTFLAERGEVLAGLSAPEYLVHGFWKHPDEPAGIDHAWIILEDGRVWEPVTGLICDPVLFWAFGSTVDKQVYTETQARINMVRHQHYGPWE